MGCAEAIFSLADWLAAVAGDVLIPFVEQTFFQVRPGMTGATGNIYVGLHEYEDMAFLLHVIREDDRAPTSAPLPSWRVVLQVPKCYLMRDK